MTPAARWPIKDHTQAKHRVLRSYLDGWIAVMGQQALRAYGSTRRLLLVDGFAGPGRYSGGEPGSPIIMLRALSEHPMLSRLSVVKFLFLFIEEDEERVGLLREEVAQLDLPSNAEVFIEHGSFEEQFGEVVDVVTDKGRTLIPTFAFVDPFGYSDAPMSLTGRFLDFPRSEALVFLPLSFIGRFLSRQGQAAALTGLFGSDDWAGAIPLHGSERSEFLVDLFEKQLLARGHVEHVISFQIRTTDRQDYRLVFATGHERGLELMKEAMWRVDPLAGTSYVAHTQTGQEVLFAPQVDTGPLLVELKNAFAGKWFTVSDAEAITLLRTPFVPGSHLKTKTLKPAEQAGLLEVVRPPGRRAGTFTADVKMRFT